MRRDHRQVFVTLALALVLVTAGCVDTLPTSQPGPSANTTASESVTTAGAADERTPTPSVTSPLKPTPSATTPRDTRSPTPIGTPVSTQPAPASPSGGTDGESSGEAASTLTSTPTSSVTTATPSVDATSTSSSQQTVEVLRVLDGDTLRVAYSDGSTGRVNLAGVDAPDLYGGVDSEEFVGVPDTSAGRTYLYAWSWIAQSTLRRLVADGSVQIRLLDSAAPAVDDYPSSAESGDVRVAYVTAGDTDVNRALLRQGVARATETDHPNRASFLGTMRTAQRAGRGLWDTDDGLRVP